MSKKVEKIEKQLKDNFKFWVEPKIKKFYIEMFIKGDFDNG
jgi:hypothetical protein